MGTFLKIAPNPLMPTVGEVLAEALSQDEYAILAERLQERFPGRRTRRAEVYLRATK